MIHSISVSNCYSVREEAVLDFRIPKTSPGLLSFRQSKAKTDVRLPSVVALMGPNGSGKTTLLRSLVGVMRFMVTPWTDREQPLQLFMPFSAEASRNAPLQFSVEFETDWLAPGVTTELFRYQISVGFDESVDTSGDKPNTVLHEALLHFPKGRSRRLFERGAHDDYIYVSREFGITPKDDRLKAIRPEASVISTLALFNVPLAKLIVERLGLCLLASNVMYFSRWTPPTNAVVDFFEKDPDAMKWVEKQIQRSDLAVQGMDIRKDKTGNGLVFLHHRGLDAPVHLDFESGGTQRLFHLLPQIHVALAHGLPAVLDEVDGDLHVDIVGEIFRLFRSEETNPNNAQLLVTSHNVGLLDDLEKEELFIVEKGDDGGTRVHGAQDVRSLRRNTRLYSKYRAGVLGGVPHIG